MRIFIGYDQRESEAFDVAASTARAFGHDVIGLHEDRLRAAGVFTRPVDRRGGQSYDILSDAPQSTDFATTRFAVPVLAHEGWALFTDCDIVFLRNPAELLRIANPKKAVMVVKHANLPVGESTKMDGQVQTAYSRKNWSSVMLVNADHPANRRLNLLSINQLPGRDLHAFSWLHDSEIGELPSEWNWLVGIQPKPVNPAIAHFTLGGPWLPNWTPKEHDDIWHLAREKK